MTPVEALDLLRRHGVVLESGVGSAPSLAEAVAGERIRGSWWSHARSHEIFALTRAIRESPDVLVCRLVDGKVTYVHRRLWAALVRAQSRLPRERLAWIRETHTESGRHRTDEVPFPDWVPEDVLAEAKGMSEEDAVSSLGALLE